MVVTRAVPPRKPPAPSPDGHRSCGREHGQATVELVALLPVLGLIALALGQAALAGWTAWSAAGAARVGARADALGTDTGPAVREVLPAMLRRHARVTTGGGEARGRVTVRLRIPAVLPGVRLGSVAVASHLPDQAGG